MDDYRKIKLIILDVDGTLTDGGLWYDSQGNEIKHFDVKDGLGIKVALENGLQFAIITGRESPIVTHRVEELKIQHIRCGVQIKYPAMKKLLHELGLFPEEVCYIGDDWNDMQCMESVGLKMCPANAANEIKRICDYVSKNNGGHGAVRNCIEFILTKRDEWEKSCKKSYFSNND